MPELGEQLRTDFPQEKQNSIRGQLFQLFRTHAPFEERKEVRKAVEGGTQTLRYLKTEKGKLIVELMQEKQKSFFGKLRREPPELMVQIIQANGTDAALHIQRKQPDKSMQRDGYTLKAGEPFGFSRNDGQPIQPEEISTLL